MLTLWMLGAAVVLVALGIVLITAGVGSSRRHAGFTRTALLTDARVVDLVADERFTNSQIDQPTTFYFPVVEFTAPDGRVVTARTIYGSATRPPARRGEVVRVRFDPQSPQRVALASGAAAGGCLGVGQTLLGSFFVIFGVIVALFWALLVLVLDVPT